MTIDSMLWCSCAITLTGVIALLLYRHVWRILPIFCTYCIWDLLSNIAVYAVHYFHPSGYLPAYLVQTILDSVIEFCVVVELTWAVLSPIRASLPRSTLVVIGVVFFALGAAIWPFAVYSSLAHYTFELRMVLHLQRTVSMLRILLFLLLAACSQWLSISWRDRELQVATGLGFMSLVSITVSVVATPFDHLGTICALEPVGDRQLSLLPPLLGLQLRAERSRAQGVYSADAESPACRGWRSAHNPRRAGRFPRRQGAETGEALTPFFASARTAPSFDLCCSIG